jgi:ABC-type proline/glycine betaine transport system substrate-binding protein
MIDFTSPNTIAFLQFIGLGFLGMVAAFGQWFGKRKESAKAQSKDVVVPSLAIADTQAITHMADTLREATRVARDHREHDTEILYTLVAIKESNQRIESILGRMLDGMRDRR